MTVAAADDRLRLLCENAVRGIHPPPDWHVEFLPGPARIEAAVVAFTGVHVVAADVDETDARAAFAADDVAAPFNPTFLAWLGRRLGARTGHVDVVLARLGTGAGHDYLEPIDEPPDNERVRRARRNRVDVEFLQPRGGDAVVALGRGLGGRLEVSLEVGDEASRGQKLGGQLLDAAVGRVPRDAALFATVAPGNVRSLRCLLTAGFKPIAAECLFT